LCKFEQLLWDFFQTQPADVKFFRARSPRFRDATQRFRQTLR
jgi:hypothetical protein